MRFRLVKAIDLASRSRIFPQRFSANGKPLAQAELKIFIRECHKCERRSVMRFTTVISRDVDCASASSPHRFRSTLSRDSFCIFFSSFLLMVQGYECRSRGSQGTRFSHGPGNAVGMPPGRDPEANLLAPRAPRSLNIQIIIFSSVSCVRDTCRRISDVGLIATELLSRRA